MYKKILLILSILWTVQAGQQVAPGIQLPEVASSNNVYVVTGGKIPSIKKIGKSHNLNASIIDVSKRQVECPPGYPGSYP
jgi:hypothetical protein